MADLDRPSTWVRFKPSMCNSCQSFCCRLPVDATIPDLIRMGVLSEDDAEESPRKIAKKLKDIIVSFRASRMIFTLAQKANGDCLYLNEQRQCSIYHNRPNVCRQFPQVGPRPDFCPYKKR